MAEKDLSNLGHADSAGVGEMEGDGEESLVNGGDAEPLLSVVTVGLGVMFNSYRVIRELGRWFNSEGRCAIMMERAPQLCDKWTTVGLYGRQDLTFMYDKL